MSGWILQPAGAVTVPQPSDNGLIGWTTDPASANSTVTPASGNINAALIRTPGGVTPNVYYVITTVGVAVTTGLLGLYTAGGVMIAQTADQSASLNSVTAQVAAPWIGGPYAVTGPYVWVLILQVASTSTAILRSGAANTTSPNLGPGAAGTGLLRSQRVSTGQTVLPASFNPAASSILAGLTTMGI